MLIRLNPIQDTIIAVAVLKISGVMKPFAKEETLLPPLAFGVLVCVGLRGGGGTPLVLRHLYPSFPGSAP